MLKWKFKWCLGVASTFALLAIGSSASASPIASVKAMGMGGASMAYGQDAMTAFYNPATATCVDNRWDISTSARYNRKELSLTDRQAGIAGLQTGNFTMNRDFELYGDFGVNWRCGSCSDWAFGVQYNNYEHIRTRSHEHITDFSGQNVGAPLGNYLKFDYQTDVLTLTSAYQVNRCHSIGVGVNVYFSWLMVEGLEAISTVVNDLSADPANASNRGTDDATGVGVTIGWHGQLTDCLWGGFSWSSKASMDDFKRYRGLLADHSIDIPEVWRAGLAYNWDCCTLLAADFEFRRYSDVSTWSNDFPGTDNAAAAFSPQFGTASGPGWGWDDQWVVKLGAEHCINECWTARMGYRHEHSLIHDNGSTDVVMNALTMNVIEDFVTFGLTWKPDSCSELSYFSEYGLQKRKKGAFPNIGAGAFWASGSAKFRNESYMWGFAYGRTF